MVVIRKLIKMNKEQIVKEIHRDVRKKFERRKYSMRGIADTLQADLIEMQTFRRKNRGYRYILIVIDVFKASICRTIER